VVEEQEPRARAPAEGTPPAIAGTIELPPELAGRTSPSDVVFVIARRPGAAGPPAAVARLEGNRYPMDFRLEDRDLMGGGSWPEELELDVRVDRDGDATTRGPDDLIGRAAAPVRRGERDVRIWLEG
jgi:cytochrome c-type biogenesis protein CcmH